MRVFARVWNVGVGLFALSGVFTAILLGGSVAPAAAAAPTYNMLGTWTTGYLEGSSRAAANGSYDITQMDMATGVLSGTAETEGVSFVLAGTESGSVAQITLTEGGYTAYDTLHLSVLAGGHIGGNGTFNSGGGFSESGTGYWAELTGPTSRSSAEEVAERAREEAATRAREEAAAKHPTATSIVCDYEFATSENTCVATVGDGTTGTPTLPTGAVTFTTTSGGFGNGASCSLAPTSGSPAVGSCTLVYETANSGLPAITATYGGDAQHASSVGHTQFLGAGLEETSTEAPAGPEGQYPNEIGIETQVPIAGSTVEATAQGVDPNPLPVPLLLPTSTAGLDPASEVDLRVTEALVEEVDVSGGQNAKAVAEMDRSVEALNQRAEELSKNPAPSEQAEGQQLLKDAAATNEALTKMLKLQSEYAKDALEGTHTAGREDKSIEKLDEHAVEMLKSSNPADQAKGQQLTEEATKQLEALSKALKQHEELIKQTANSIKASAASSKRRATIKVAHIKPLAHGGKRNAAAGKLKLKLPLSRAGLNRLAGKRKSVTVVLRVEMLLPSAHLPGGLPRAFVERITLKRTPAGKGHRPAKKH
jgi:hypothetical protein